MYREGYSCTHPQQSHKTTLAGILRQDSFVWDNPLDSPEYQISAGLIDDPSELQMSLQVFTDNKPQFYE